MSKGFFMTLEGGEGVGKSTQAPLLAEGLRRLGYTVCLTREPGGTPGAEALRELLLFGKADLSRRAEIMAHMAARCDHLDHLILPALARGEVVICDRFHDSTLAYQGYGQGEGQKEVLAFIASLRALVGCEPDATFWLEAAPDITAERLQKRAQARGVQLDDRYEKQNAAFHARVREGFAKACVESPDRMLRVEASGTAEEVHQTLLMKTLERLKQQGLQGKAVGAQ